VKVVRWVGGWGVVVVAGRWVDEWARVCVRVWWVNLRDKTVRGASVEHGVASLEHGVASVVK
jgi:hypothetical protein